MFEMQAVERTLRSELQYRKRMECYYAESGKGTDVVFEVRVANVEHVNPSMKMANLTRASQYLKRLLFPTFKEHIT